MKKLSALNICFLIALVAIFFIPKFSSAQVVINEIFNDPVGNNDTGKEWIELYNSGNQAVELGSWQINGSGKYFTLPAFSIPPNSFLVIRWRADGQNTANEIFTGTATINENIGNTSGLIALFTSSEHNKETIVDYVEYGKAGQTLEATAASAGIWQREQFVTAASEGQSLGLKQDGQDGNATSDWQIFSSPTPGQSNSTIISPPQPEAPPLPDDTTPETTPDTNASSTLPAFSNYSEKISINEFMPWPQTGSEWVELYNAGNQTIDLSNWQIDDVLEASQPYKIPAGTLISPSQYLVIELNKNIFNNEGDQVRLIWPDSQLLHSVSYQDAQAGLSSGRFEDGWFWTDQPTPGQENKKSAPKAPAPSQNQIKNPSLPDTPAVSQQNSPSSIQPSEPSSNPQNALLSNEPSAPTSITAAEEVVGQEENKNSSKKSAADTSGADMAAEQSSMQIQAAATQVPAVAQMAEKNAGFSPWLALAAVAVLSLLSGIGIVYFKRKKVIDPVQKP